MTEHLVYLKVNHEINTLRTGARTRLFRISFSLGKQVQVRLTATDVYKLTLVFEPYRYYGLHLHVHYG